MVPWTELLKKAGQGHIVKAEKVSNNQSGFRVCGLNTWADGDEKMGEEQL